MMSASYINKSLLVMTLLAAGAVQAGTEIKFQNGSLDPLKSQVMSGDVSFSSSAQDHVVQFRSSITEADKAAAKALGIEIFRYVPDDALIVRANDRQLAKWAATGKIRASMLFKGAMKLDSSLSGLSVFSLNQKKSILISAFSEADAKNILLKLQSRDSELEVLEQMGRSLAVRMQAGLVADLLNITGVEYVQAVPVVEMMQIDLLDSAESEASPENHPLTGFESGTRLMGFESIWSQGYSGQGQTVAVADTGLDVGTTEDIHSDFQDSILNGHVYGIGAKNWSDPMGHGTHVAGSVAGRGVYLNGELRGGAFSSKLVPQGMWSPILENLTVPPKLGQMFQASYADGARIHTNSWGSPRNLGVYDAMAQQVDEFMWANPDFLILFAAGNSGVDENKDGKVDSGSISSPATAKNTLSVGASENKNSVGGIQKDLKELKGGAWSAEPLGSSKISDNENGIAVFSSRGPTKDGRRKPEIVAPGTNILSARSHEKGASPMWGAYNADYTYAGGTSMATPLTAGAASVTRQVLSEKFKVANPSAALVKAMLLHTAFDMFPGQYGMDLFVQELKKRPDSDQGYGRVDMKKLADLSNQTQVIESAVAQAEVFEQTVVVKDGTLLVNLVYTDAPGTPSAGATLVNDLDLRVVSQSGQVFQKSDSINNNEIVELNGLQAGTYKVQVLGVKVPMGKEGKQPFALVSTAL